LKTALQIISLKIRKKFKIGVDKPENSDYFRDDK